MRFIEQAPSAELPAARRGLHEDGDRRPSGAQRVQIAGGGRIRPDMQTATVQFPGGETVFVVALSHFRWPNGSGWSFFRCACGRQCRTLRFYEGSPACRRCLAERGLRSRVELIRTENRAAYHAPRILARLNSATPARINPRNGQMLDKRSHLEARLRRTIIVAKQFALDEHDELLAKLMRDK
jgi:hypothetical protein